MKHKVYITKRKIKGAPFDSKETGKIRLRAEWPDIASLELDMGVLTRTSETDEFAKKLEPKLLKMMDKLAEAYAKNMRGGK